MKTYNGFISYSDLIKAIRFVDWNIDTAIDFITINVMQQSIANFNKRMGKEKVTKKLQFLSDQKGVPITEHIRILQFNFKVLKLKSQEFYYKGE